MSGPKQIAGVKACVFDAYGTLFDFASAARTCEDVPPDKRAALAALWRDKQLQYAWLRSLQNRYVDFGRVTADALDFALETLSLASPERRETLMQLYRELSPYPEAPEVVRALRERGFKTAILSNGSPEMLTPLVHASAFARLFDAVLSADAVGVFKTHPAVYDHALSVIGLKAKSIVFVSSNGWDAWAASDFGMRVVWCNRAGQVPERLPRRAGRRDRDAGGFAGAARRPSRLTRYSAGAISRVSMRRRWPSGMGTGRLVARST